MVTETERVVIPSKSFVESVLSRPFYEALALHSFRPAVNLPPFVRIVCKCIVVLDVPAKCHFAHLHNMSRAKGTRHVINRDCFDVLLCPLLSVGILQFLFFVLPPGFVGEVGVSLSTCSIPQGNNLPGCEEGNPRSHTIANGPFVRNLRAMPPMPLFRRRRP